MSIYLISDTHFNHEAIIDYCGRPKDYEEKMRWSMLDIGRKNVLLHLGDVALGKEALMHELYIKPLTCKK